MRSFDICGVQAIEQAFQVHTSAIAEALPHLVTHVNSGTQVSLPSVSPPLPPPPALHAHTHR